MTRKLSVALALSVLAFAAPVLASDAEIHDITLETTSVGNVGHCEVSVSRSVKVCDADGSCQRTPLTEDEITFSLPKGGAFIVTASVSYRQDGVIHGDAAVDRFERVSEGERLVQSLKTGENCSQVFSYELHAQ